MRRELLERVGYFDEVYNPGYFEETDYCYRAQAKGIGVGRARAAYVYHKGSASFNRLDSKSDLFKRNEEIFFRRWGRPVRIGYFVNTPDASRRVSDIAAGAARMGHQILIFLKDGVEWPVAIDHFDIRRVDMTGTFFGLGCLYAIWKRKKKKRVDVILSDDRSLGKFFEMSKRLHQARVIIRPDKEKVLELLGDISRKTSDLSQHQYPN
jgi:hypothetical protein